MGEDDLPPPPPPPPPPTTTAQTWVARSDDQTLAALAHAGQLVGGFLVPLIIYLMKRDQSAFVEDQAKEALNFSITVMLAMIASVFLMLVIIGILLMFVVLILAVVMPIVAAIASNRGEYYRYPLCIRLVT